MQEYLIIVLFTLVLFFRTLKYDLVVDDNNAWKSAQSAKDWRKHTLSTQLVKLNLLIYGAGLFKDHEKDHLFTMILNCIFGCLLYAAFNNIWLPLLWLSHPINNQLTLWLNGRRYMFSLIFGLISVLFPMTGIITYPVALWFHPIAAPFIILGLIKTPTAIFWLTFIFLLSHKYKLWMKSRRNLQPFEEYFKFNIGKISLSFRCLGEYFIHLFAPIGFTMYHPTIWGVAELPGLKARNYAWDYRLMGYTALILLTIGVGWLGGLSCLKWAILAIVGVFMWLGVWKSYTQLWAQRYASLFSIFGILFILEAIDRLAPVHFQFTLKIILLTYYICITLKDMDMYKSWYWFFLRHVINYPYNQNAYYFATIGFNNNAHFFKKDKKIIDSLMNDAISCSCGLLWAMHNPKPDLIHEFMKSKINVQKVGK